MLYAAGRCSRCPMWQAVCSCWFFVGKNRQKGLFTKSLFYFINFSKSEKSTKAVQLCKGSIRPAVSLDEVSLSSCPHGLWPCGSCPSLNQSEQHLCVVKKVTVHIKISVLRGLSSLGTSAAWWASTNSTTVEAHLLHLQGTSPWPEADRKQEVKQQTKTVQKPNTSKCTMTHFFINDDNSKWLTAWLFKGKKIPAFVYSH